MLKRMFEIILISSLIILNGCVGTIEDANPESSKSANTDSAEVVFAGIVSATAVSDSKVVVSFLPATGDQSKRVYLIYVNNSDTPMEVNGSSLTADYSGQLNFTVTGLEVNRTYSFAVGVRDTDTGVASNNNKIVYATTFTNYTADFNGISKVYTASGEDGQTSVIVEWVAATTKGSTYSPKATDPIAYEVRYIKASDGGPSALKNKNNESVNVSVNPTTYNTSSSLSTETSRTITGLTSNTKYYFMVRCIHKGYTIYGDDSSYKLEENTKVLSVTTDSEGGLLEWDNESVSVTAPDGEEGTNSADVSWTLATGTFKFYRVFYVQIGDPEDEYTDVEANAPTFDEAYIDSLNNSGDYVDVEASSSYVRLSSLTSYGYYKLTVHVCTNSSCSDGYRVAGNDLIYRVTPSIAPFSGILSINDPETLTDINNPGVTDTIKVNFDAPVISAGYVNKFELYCFSSIDDGSPTLLEYNVTNTSGKEGCDGLKRITQTPTSFEGIGEFSEMYIEGDFIPAGQTSSTRRFCFGAIPVIEGDNYEVREIGNATVKCKTIEIAVPNISEFSGVTQTCDSGFDFLNVAWTAPTNGIYDSYEVFWKEVDGKGFKYSDAIASVEAGDGEYFSDDSLVSGDLSFVIENLTPGKSYTYGILAYLDGTTKSYSEYNAGTQTCVLDLPSPKFGEWVDLFAIGPKTDGRVPLSTIGEPTFLFETFTDDGLALEVQVDSETDAPTTDFDNQFGSISGGDKFDGAYGTKGAVEGATEMHQYSNSGIVRIVWKDITFPDDDDATADASMSDYIDAYEVEDVAKKDREYGYRVYRSEDGGRSWVNLTSKDYEFQTQGNSGLIHPKDYTERARVNADAVTFKVGEFIDYSVKYSEASGSVDRARVYYYKVVPVFSGKEMIYTRADSNPQHQVKVVLPPPNMGLVHRLMANRQMCQELNKEYSTDISEYYTCSYNGVGAKGLSSPWVKGSTVYDFGGSSLIDRYELGCNYTRGDQQNIDSYFAGSYDTFTGQSDNGSNFKGCLMGIYSSYQQRNGGDTSNTWADGMYWVGDCLYQSNLSMPSKICSDPDRASIRRMTGPGLYQASFDCQDSDDVIANALDPYGDANLYEETMAQSEYLAVAYLQNGRSQSGDTFISPYHRGANGDESDTDHSSSITADVSRTSRCMINIPVTDLGDSSALKPRWLGVNQLSQLNHEGSNYNILDYSVSAMEALSGFLFDSSRNSLPDSSYRTSYNKRYEDETPLVKVFSSNNAKLPPLQGVTQNQAEVICGEYQVEVGTEVDDTFSSNKTYKKRLMRRSEALVASAYPKSYDETRVTETENGSRTTDPVTSGTSFEPGCNTNGKNLTAPAASIVAGSALRPTMAEIGGTVGGSYSNSWSYGGSSIVDQGGIGTNSQECMSRYGLQDMVGNVAEFSSERIFCDFSSEHLYWANGSGAYQQFANSVDDENADMAGDNYNPANIVPWTYSDPGTGLCSMVSASLDRDTYPAETGGEIYPVYDIFGTLNASLFTETMRSYYDEYFFADYRNGDGFFLDFGQSGISPPLSYNDTLALYYNSVVSARGSNGDQRKGKYFNPVVGFPLACNSGSCSESSDNMLYSITPFVNDAAATLFTDEKKEQVLEDGGVLDFPIGASNILSNGMSEITTNENYYSIPNVNSEDSITYVDTVHPDQDGGTSLDQWVSYVYDRALSDTTGDATTISRTYWTLNRSRVNNYGIQFLNMGDADDNWGTGRYSTYLYRGSESDAQRVNVTNGFRCAVKLDEEKY